MPLTAGFDIGKVEIAPDINSDQETPNLIEIAEKISSDISQSIPMFSISDEIIKKGKEMAEAYIFLYFVENTVRIFIEHISKNRYGNNYWNSLSISNEIKKGIQVKKNQEQKNKYITLRGDNELYYCDFKELGLIISYNWDLFKKFFPTTHWIEMKMEEMGNCRNLIAHNSYIDEHNRELIKVNYQSIIKQIRKAF